MTSSTRIAPWAATATLDGATTGSLALKTKQGREHSFARFLAPLAMAALCAPAAGAFTIGHVDANDPATEGFHTNTYQNDSTEGPIANDLGHAVWSIKNLDTASQFSYQSGALTAAQSADAAKNGVTLTLVARVLPGVSSARYTASQPITLAGAFYDNGSVRWEIDLGLNAQNDVVVILPTSINDSGPGGSILAFGASYTLKGLGDGYNTYQLTVDPKTSLASLYVNGVEVLEKYTGETAFVKNAGLTFDAFSGGQGSFSLVQLSTGSPTISSLQPGSVDAGSPAFTLTVNGSNFANGDSVDWNGVPLATTFVSASKLTAKVSAAEAASAGSAAVTVVDTAAENAASTPALFSLPLTSLVVATQTIKTISSGYSITLTLKNSGFDTATGITLSGAYLGTATSTSLPVDIASIAPNSTKSVTLNFPSSAGEAGGQEYLSIFGSYAGGGIALTSVETLP